MKIGEVSIGVAEMKKPASPVMATVANTIIICTALIAIFMAPMPEGWIPVVLKNYILTVSSGLSGFVKVLEKLSSQSPNLIISADAP